MGAGEKASAVSDGFTLRTMDPKEINNLARQFVIQYYTVMRECPPGLHRFYKDDSAVINEDTTIFGQKLIHENFMRKNFHDVRIGILCLDALRLGHNSVLIQVSGEISKAGSDFRRFTQSFALSEQAPCDFYVVNDIFKYQDLVYGDVKPESQGLECNGVANSHPFVDELVKRKAVSQSAEATILGNTHGQQLPCENQLDSTPNVSAWRSQTYNDGPSQQPETALQERTLNKPDENTILSEPVNTVTSSPISQESSVSSALESPAAPVQLSQPLSWAQMASQQASKPTGRAYTQSYQINDDKQPARHMPNVHGQANSKARPSGQRPTFDDKSSGAGDHGLGKDTMTNRQAGPPRVSGSGGRGFSRGGGGGGRASGGRGAAGGGPVASCARMPPNAMATAGFGSRRG